MKKFTDIAQFRNVIRELRLRHDYKGKDGDGEPIYQHTEPYPTLKFKGTVKLHGTNSGIVRYVDGSTKFQSRERELTLEEDNAGFMQENSVKSLDFLFDGIEFEDYIAIYGEWCGCFSYNTPILLADGSTLPIGKIVNEKLEVLVKSYDFKTNSIVDNKITGWHRNGQTDIWVRLEVKRRKRGGKGTGLVVTPNHKIFISENEEIIEKTVADATVGDLMVLNANQLPYYMNQFLRGTLMGDGSFVGNRIVKFSHSDNKQNFYNNFISNNLSKYLSSEVNQISGFGSSMRVFSTYPYPEVEDMFDELKPLGVKKPTYEFLNKLSPLALAVWYMDDGSLMTHKEFGRSQKACLHVQGFGKVSVELIKNWLDSRGYYCNLVYSQSEKDCEIRLTPQGTIAFLYTIAPYVLEEFNYKLPHTLSSIQKIKWWNHLTSEYEHPFVTTPILSKESFKPKEGYLKQKYDISVEDTANYFANNLLVHNSNIQKGVALNGLPKMLVIFGCKIDGNWIDFRRSDHEQGIYNINDFPTFEVTIDFNNPELSQNRLIELTEEVERECPVGKFFGVSGIGEGIVFSTTYNDEHYMFKSKGEKHSVSKVKTIAAVDVELVESMNAFVDYAVTENRLKQGIEYMKRNRLEITQKNTGEFLRWVVGDIVKEETDVMESNGLKQKKLNPLISTKARQWYFNNLEI